MTDTDAEGGAEARNRPAQSAGRRIASSADSGPSLSASTCLLLALALLLPASCEARSHPGWSAKAVPIAARYWGSDCDVIVTHGAMVAPDFSGEARLGDCADGYGLITVTPVVDSMPWAYQCSVTIHEFGHLIQPSNLPLSKAHSADPTDVMATDITALNVQTAVCGRRPT